MTAAARQKAWQDLIAVAALEPGDATPVTWRGRQLAVYDGTAGITVSFALCPHSGANLCDGYFDGRNIECPLHQALFDAQSGAVKAGPALRPLRMVETRVEAGMVQVYL